MALEGESWRCCSLLECVLALDEPEVKKAAHLTVCQL